MHNSSDSELALNMRRLRLRHMEVLLAVARHESITAAAQALGSTQPAVSQWLAEVESAMGVPLFTRGRQIQPTAFLPTALRHARRMVADSHQLQTELQAIADGASGQVRLGVMSVAAAALIPRAIIGLKASEHKLRLNVVEDIAAGLWARFERNELDVIVGRLDERAFRPGLRRETLYGDVHAVVARRGHKLARSRRLTWELASGSPWVLPPPDTALRRAIDASFVENGCAPPQPWVESASVTVTEEVLRQTACLGVLSGAVAQRSRDLGILVTIPLELTSNVGPIGMIWDERESSPALEAVLQALRAPDTLS